MNITNEMRISKDDFRAMFPKADYEVFYRDPKSDVEFMERFLPNKLWRLNNLHTIVDKNGVRRRFIMNRPQLRVYAASLQHPRLIILKSRQQGISTFWLICYADDAIFNPDLSIGLMAQGRDEAGTLLTRTKLDWNNFDETIKNFMSASIIKDNADEIGLSNGSTIFIRTSFRSATLQRLHISEYGKICNKSPHKAEEVKTGTLQTVAPGNNAVIESTAEGTNDFKKMWEKDYLKNPAKLGPKEFYCIFLSWLDDDDCRSSMMRTPSPEQAKYFANLEEELNIVISPEQKNFWIDQYDELGERTFQEYPATPEEAFKAVRQGTFYAILYTKHVVAKGRVRENLWDPNLSVEVAMDIGMNDDFVLGFFQVWRNEYRLIHEYRNAGEGIEHYTDYIAATPYEIDTVHGPHDLAVRELNTAQTREGRFHELNDEYLAEHGVKIFENLEVLPKLPIATGIELVRKILPNFYIDVTCTYIHDCYLNYSKEWDEKFEVWKDKPRHDEFSHGMDMIRYLAMSDSRARVTIQQKKAPKRRSRQVVDGMCM